MPTKTKQKKSSDWKNIIQIFVGDILEKVEDNLSHRVQKLISKIKKRAVASLLMANGLIFLLIGLASYASAILDTVAPGLGYMAVGAVIVFAGYLIGKD